MDDALRELVSRAVDDDLDAAEAARLAARAADDPELAAELARARELREAVARLAGSMAPPPALDAVVEPLRRSPPTDPPRVRPAVRWLGLAAAIVLGATVALEVARRNPAPTTEPQRPPRVRAVDDEAIFELAPLPTADPDEARPFGAAERLLAQEPPEPRAPEPEPLDVIGPLPLEDSAAEAVAPLDKANGAGAAAQESRTGEALDLGGRSEDEAPAASAGLDAAEDRALRQRVAPPAAAAEGSRVGPALDEAKNLAVVVAVAGRPVWWGRAAACPAGRWTAVLEIRDGVVVSVAPTAAAVPCRPEGLVGARLEGLEDGRHAVEILVGGEPQ